MRVSIEHKDELECLTLFLIFMSIAFRDIHALGSSYSNGQKDFLTDLPYSSSYHSNLSARLIFLNFSSDYIYQQNPLLFIIMNQMSSTILSLVCVGAYKMVSHFLLCLLPSALHCPDHHLFLSGRICNSL